MAGPSQVRCVAPTFRVRFTARLLSYAATGIVFFSALLCFAAVTGIVAEIAGALKFKAPTIMLNGDIADRHVEKAKLIADRMLPKPLDIDLLLNEMRTLLAKQG